MGDVEVPAALRQAEAYSILASPSTSEAPPSTGAGGSVPKPPLPRFYSEQSLVERYRLLEHPLVREARNADYIQSSTALSGYSFRALVP